MNRYRSNGHPPTRRRAMHRAFSLAAATAAFTAPVFWLAPRPWALVLLGSLGLIGGLLFMVHRGRMHRLLEIGHETERMRRRIASDLHDGVGAKVSSIALLIEVISRSSSLCEEERLRLEEAAEEARQVVDDLRDAVWLIDSGSDGLSDLVLRMEKIARQMLRSIAHYIALPDLATVPSAKLEMETRRHVVLAFKEALHNALRHSRAKRITILIDVQDGWLSFEVIDDGQGFDEAIVEAGHGLASMRRRAHEIGGCLTTRSRPGTGTTMRLSVPVA